MKYKCLSGWIGELSQAIEGKDTSCRCYRYHKILTGWQANVEDCCCRHVLKVWHTTHSVPGSAEAYPSPTSVFLNWISVVHLVGAVARMMPGAMNSTHHLPRLSHYRPVSDVRSQSFTFLSGLWRFLEWKVEIPSPKYSASECRITCSNWIE